jgi:transposase InsO family protein
VEAFADNAGHNRHLEIPIYYSPEDSAFDHCWKGLRIYANGPFQEKMLTRILEKAHRAFRDAPSTSTFVILVPAWYLTATTQRLVDKFTVLKTIPKGTRAYTATGGVDKGPTRWDTIVLGLNAGPQAPSNLPPAPAHTLAELQVPTTWATAYLADPDYSTLYTALDTGLLSDEERHAEGLRLVAGRIEHNGKVILPGPLVDSVIRLYHINPYYGHFGVTKTCAFLGRYFFLEHLRDHVTRVLRLCHVCQAVKYDRRRKQGILRSMPIPRHRWCDIHIDWMTEFPLTPAGHDRILTIVDRLTKRVHLVPTKATDTVEDLWSHFVKGHVRLHGLPVSITSDRDILIDNAIWKGLCARLGVECRLTVTGRAQANGQAEALNKSAKMLLQTLVVGCPSDLYWDDYLVYVEIAINNSVNASTGYSPFFVDLGYHPTFPGDVAWWSKDRESELFEQFVGRLKRLLDTTQGRLQKAVDVQQTKFNRSHRPEDSYSVDEFVWLICPESRNPQAIDTPKYGPYRIVKKKHPVYELDMTVDKWRGKPTFNSNDSFRRYVPDPRALVRPFLALPRTVAKKTLDDTYDVEVILGHRSCPDSRTPQLQYLVKWVDCDHQANTWEPLKHLVSKTGKGPTLVNEALLVYCRTHGLPPPS